MAALAFFTETSISAQAAIQAYGVESADKFRVSSMFTISATTKAYAMMKGTILLQQQTSDADKVNLILKPHDQKELKLPVKYIIYRGLQINDFITNNDLSDPANKVKTSSSELLDAIKIIQQNRAPNEDIPLEALFGNELMPSNDKNIDGFFFKDLAPSSQLFMIDCGIELGKFAVGNIGIEIILENPEFFVDVELAKEPKHEREVNGISDTAEKKWEKDLVRHFVDPAAFYGLHHNIEGGIEYRTTSGKQSADTPGLVYSQIVDKFQTKNKVYLDVRNENGYSYNYYDNYLGTGANADKEIKIANTSEEIEDTDNPNYINAFKEYYTNNWAIHIVDVITPGAGEDNEFFIAFRVNDNEKPLLAGWNVELAPISETDPPLTDNAVRRVYFTDETVLLPNPDPLPEFTEAVSIKVPNVPSESAQLATIIRLDYIKQIQFFDPNVGDFPYWNRTDYLFGPITTQIPWDSKEYIHQFLDAAAFWGSHIECGSIKSVGTSAEMSSTNDVFTNILNKYQTKNKLYFYIQAEKGRSYNYYDDKRKVYGVDSSGIKNETNGWPILIKEKTFSGSDNTLNIELDVIINTNIDPFERRVSIDVIAPNNKIDSIYPTMGGVFEETLGNVGYEFEYDVSKLFTDPYYNRIFS